MNGKWQTTYWRRQGFLAALGLGLCMVAGCLSEPEIDERWTLLEFVTSDPRPAEVLGAETTLPVSVAGRITYRAIRTGFLVAEVRYSLDLPPSALSLDPDEHTLAGSHEIERVLQNSVTAGRATKAVTGFDHLVQRVDFVFDAVVPTGMFTGDPDSVANRGLYLVMYLGSGEEIKVQGNRDSLVVTPMPVDANELLITGFALDVRNPAVGSTP